METKTCKTCKEQKEITKFECKRHVCKKCREKTRCNKHKNTFSDRIIKSLIISEHKHRYKKIIKQADITSEMLEKKRNQLIIKRKNREEWKKAGGLKKCTNCEKMISSRAGLKCTNCYNKEKGYSTKASKKAHNNITDTYIKSLIMATMNKYVKIITHKIKAIDISQDFIKLKRKEQLIKRKIENGNKKDHTKGS